MNKLSRKLMISVFTLAFALITLGATTFAWFTLTSTAAMDAISLDIVAGQGIEISVDGTTYRNQISIDEIKTAILGNKANNFAKLDAVTSQNGYNFLDLDNVSVNKGFLEFQLWFRSPTQNARVYLDTNTKTSSGDGTSWLSDTTFSYRGTTVSSGTSVKIYAANALRFSFEEHLDGTTVNKVFTNPKMFGETPERKPTVFELDATLPTNETITNMRLDSTVPQLPTVGGMVNYWYNKLGSNILDGRITEPETNAKYIVLPQNVKGNSNGLGTTTVGEVVSPKATIATLEKQGTDPDKNYYGFMMVRIWLEGWDPDNFDAMLNKSLSIIFSFSVAGASTPESIVLTAPGDMTGTEGSYSIEKAIGATFSLTKVVLPSTANQNVIWSITGTAATISNTGVITVLGDGEVTVTATSEAGTINDTFTFNITQPA